MDVSEGTDLAQRKDFDIQSKVCNQLYKTSRKICHFRNKEFIKVFEIEWNLSPAAPVDGLAIIRMSPL